MKKLTLMLITLLTVSTSFAQFNMVGSTIGGAGTYNLCPASGCGSYQAGAIWCNGTAAALPQYIDFTHGFTLSYFSQTTTNGYTSADGYCVVFGHNINILTSINNSNAFLGYYDLPTGPINPDFINSLGVEFDDFDNSYYPYLSDQLMAPYTDHTQMSIDANPGSGAPFVNPVSVFPSGATMSDGILHHIVLVWDCSAQTLSEYVDGIFRISGTFNPWARFVNATQVEWGFTAGTGSACSDQVITQVSLNNTNCCCPKMPCTCVQQTGGYFSGGGTWIDYQFLFTSCSPTATIYYECVDAAGNPLCPGPFSVMPGTTITLAYINTFCPGTCGICIVGVCDGGCCWGITPSTPGGTALLTCCAMVNHLKPGHSTSTTTNAENKMSLMLMPNPNNGAFTISGNVSKGTAKQATIEVLDLIGKTILTETVNIDNGVIFKDVKIGNIAPGEYLVRVTNSDGSQVIRFTVEK